LLSFNDGLKVEKITAMPKDCPALSSFVFTLVKVNPQETYVYAFQKSYTWETKILRLPNNGNLRYDLSRNEWMWLPKNPDELSCGLDVAVNYRNQGVFIFGVGKQFPNSILAAYLDLK
jgi:hypothetical protein